MRTENLCDQWCSNVVELLAKFIDEAESGALGTITEQTLAEKLEKYWADQFIKRVPRQNYKSDGNWLSALLETIHNYLYRLTSRGANSKTVEEWLSDELFMERELAIEEQLNAMIDKTIKRLAQTKTFKEIGIGSRRVSTNNGPSKNETLKLVESPAI
jgi:hypothetical protein